MLIQYDGPHPEVVVDEFSQDVIVGGTPTEIPDDLAARLLEQSTWSKSPAATPATSAPQSTPTTAPSAPGTDPTKGNS